MSDDPPLTPCPPWCEMPPGHDWEDMWGDGLIRYHKVFKSVSGDRFHNIGIQEIEQATPNGTVRQRDLVFDVEAPTCWDKAAAVEAMDIAREMMELALVDWPDGEAR